MANIQEKISKLFPQAAFAQTDVLEMTIADEQWHDLAHTLRHDPELSFDFLVTIAGMDWKENGLGCIYELVATSRNERVSVKVMATGDREKPFIHSVFDIWDIATVYEREVYDYFGIIFVNNPDMRRLFLNIDWKGYPLRKDYNDDPDINPVSIENERQTDFTDTWVEREGKIVKEERRIFQADDFVVNIGPQHPATHGVLRFRTAVDGEIIKKIDLYLGYIHRGVEIGRASCRERV
nr:NADH-quinone oxidoreductase subunit C [uncultured Duncaniella sp.]